MLIIPAIDILDGKAVRLLRGDYDSATTYDDPVAVARRFQAAGARRIHLVDLDAARGGVGNRPVIRRIRHAVSCELEVGGGIRSIHDVEELFDIGIDYQILGTILVSAPATAAAWTRRFGQRFIAGIDARGGAVQVSGWTADGSTSDEELAAKAAEMGMCAVIYTAIENDGTMTGPNIERTGRTAAASRLPTIVSGGIGTMADLERVEAAVQAGTGIAGAIVGKALYEKTIDIVEAISKFGR